MGPWALGTRFEATGTHALPRMLILIGTALHLHMGFLVIIFEVSMIARKDSTDPAPLLIRPRASITLSGDDTLNEVLIFLVNCITYLKSFAESVLTCSSVTTFH